MYSVIYGVQMYSKEVHIEKYVTLQCNPHQTLDATRRDSINILQSTSRPHDPRSHDPTIPHAHTTPHTRRHVLVRTIHTNTNTRRLDYTSSISIYCGVKCQTDQYTSLVQQSYTAQANLNYDKQRQLRCIQCIRWLAQYISLVYLV